MRRRTTSILGILLVLLFNFWTTQGQDPGDATLVVNGEGNGAVVPLLQRWIDGYAYHNDYAFNTFVAGIDTRATVDKLANATNNVLWGFVDYLEVDYAVNKGLKPLVFVAYGVTFPYRLDALPLNASVVLDVDILARIFENNITQWDDTAIQSLNPDFTMPTIPIRVILYNQSAPATSTLTQALAQVSSVWSAHVSPPIGTYVNFTEISGLTNRTLFSASADSSVNNVIELVDAYDGTLAYVMGPEFTASGSELPTISLMRGSTLVSHSATSVQQALRNSEEYFKNATNGALSIANPSDETAWPICSTAYFIVPTSRFTSRCSEAETAVKMLQWTNINDDAIRDANSLNYGRITTALLYYIRSNAGGLTCSASAYVPSVSSVGEPATAAHIRAWARVGSSDLSSVISVTYEYSSRQEARDAFFNAEVDFAIDIESYSADDFTKYEDIIQVPAYAIGLAIAVNLPGVTDYEMTLTADILAAIYTGSITMWNHPNILALNPSLVGVLNQPNLRIRAITRLDDSAETLIFTQTLHAMVPQYGIVANVTASFTPQTPRPTLTDNMANTLNRNGYSIGYISYPTLLQAQTLGIAPNVAVVNIINSANNSVTPQPKYVMAAISDYGVSPYSSIKTATRATASQSLLGNLTNSPGSSSYPFSTYGYFSLRTQHHNQACFSYSPVLTFFTWVLTADFGIGATTQYGATSLPPSMVTQVLTMLGTLQCDNAPVLAIGCFNNDDGTICSNVGSCKTVTRYSYCVCPSGYSGTFCSRNDDSSSTTATIYYAVIIAGVVPACIALCLCLIVACVVGLIVTRSKNKPWAVDFSEIELKQQIGAGGFGAVHKAVWKDSDVAVKLLAGSGGISREIKRNFVNEVRVMTQLRHPNVVLFMGACTTPPNLCIIMEFMELGSLYDVLHNELVPKLPISLKIKLASQAAQGMHFLHSSGILHRDLKSPNILLDDKWNAKISDFGLTRFKQQESTSDIDGFGGSLLWTAPEILGEEAPFSEAADMYSFGIILWELLTGEDPYSGLNPTTVAVCVLRDNLRPTMPENVQNPDYAELILNCWDRDPSTRPSFLEALTRLKAMASSTSTGTTEQDDSQSRPSVTTLGSLNPFNDTTGTHTSSSDGSSSGNERKLAAIDRAVQAPKGEMVIAFTDIAKAGTLWEFCPEGMRDATVMHNNVIRQTLQEFHGYEVSTLREGNATNGVGSFCVAFQQAPDALKWAVAVQERLMNADWDAKLLSHPAAAEEWGGRDDDTIFRGLRVRMGLAIGTPRPVRDPMTRRIEYVGPVVNIAARITALAHGGQILVSAQTRKALRNVGEIDRIVQFLSVGKVDLAGDKGVALYEAKSASMNGRFFGGMSVRRIEGSNASNKDKNPLTFRSLSRSMHSSEDSSDAIGDAIEMDEFDMGQVDTFLTSANLCRWIIDFKHIEMGKQIGQGSYGMVYKARWKGVDVAVKRLTKQKLNERDMLDFRAEVAFLSEMHHPNIVLFIGACVRKPNLCVVTEHVKQGSLQEVLLNKSIKLTWQMRMKIARGAALGVFYLHSLDPVILHRDLKSSNILIDENWNAKVADFGFARVRQDNATMTRCGSPCWTAPEIIQGKKYTEKADVYAFGIILWEILTRQQPFKGLNYMNVSLDVVAGTRPKLPGNTPKDFAKLVNRCWHAQYEKRPSMQRILKFFDNEDTNTDDTLSLPHSQEADDLLSVAAT